MHNPTPLEISAVGHFAHAQPTQQILAVQGEGAHVNG